MADMGIRAPLYLQVPAMQPEVPVAVECPDCFAVVLAAHLDEHKRASHG